MTQIVGWLAPDIPTVSVRVQGPAVTVCRHRDGHSLAPIALVGGRGLIGRVPGTPDETYEPCHDQSARMGW